MSDTDSDNFEGTSRQAAVLDQAMSTLLADLHAKDLLDQTLVVLPTEFGRTSRIYDNDGRDHQHKVSTCLLGGDGMERGHAQRQLQGDLTEGGSPRSGDERPTD